MYRFPLGLVLSSITLLPFTAPVQAAALIFSYSSVCANGSAPQCTIDERAGDPALSIATRYEINDPADGIGAYSYSGEAKAAGLGNSIIMLASAGGGTAGPNDAGGVGQFGMSATAEVRYHDELTVSGSGFGTVVIPWHMTGDFAFEASPDALLTPRATFGVPFCQSMATGSGSGGAGCSGGGTQTLTNATHYDEILLLAFDIEFGVSYSLDTTFNLSVDSGAGLTTSVIGDFQHTGLLLPAFVFDGDGTIMSDVAITAASGVDYLDPQATIVATPLPPSLPLFAAGMLGLGWVRRNRVRTASRPTTAH